MPFNKKGYGYGEWWLIDNAHRVQDQESTSVASQTKAESMASRSTSPSTPNVGVATEAFGFEPIAIEEAAGRSEYVRAQSVLTHRAQTIRCRLIDRCSALLTGQVPRPTDE